MATSGSPYLEGSTIRLSVVFTVSGTATDPTTVTLKTENPSGTQTSYTYAAGTVSRDSAGAYHKDITPDAVGLWTYRYIGTGTAAGVAESTFRITPSEID